jgi:hypothetical protein
MKNKIEENMEEYFKNVTREEFKEDLIQAGFKVTDMIKTVQEPENSLDKLLEFKEKYNITNKDFRNMIYYMQMYLITGD